MRLLSSVFTLSEQFEQQKQKVVDAQEDERRRMAAELHDELGQHLTALRFELDSLTEHSDSKALGELVNTLKQRSQRMSDIFRSNLEQLRPPELERYGLRRCLQQLVSDLQQHYPGTTVLYDFECNERLLGEQGQLVAYRVVQECLTNIRRHAGDVGSVQIRLYRELDSVMIAVSDNGLGCDLTQVSGGFGLIGMRERVNAVSGQLEIESQPGRGMLVLAAIPINVES
jgi:two-component system sensor histidine kinase UhpB